jgi:hypothetical protein
LAGLPASVRLDTLDGAGREIVVATCPHEAAALRETGATVLGGDEWHALAIGAESDRVFAGDLPVLLALRGPGRITEESVLAGARPDASRGWSVGTVLGRLGLEPARPGVARAANGEPSEGRVEHRAA